MNVVDLFAGAGGLSYGFQMAGCRVLCGIDNDKDCAATFRKNHPRSEYLTKNIEDVTSDDMTRLVGRNKVDILVGGPPCQGFSISGKRTSSDPRNQLYAHFLRIADMLSPQAVLIENVPGLQALFGGRVFADIVDKLHKRGFKTSVKVVSADDYGVPQSRKRIMIVGARNEKYVFPRAQWQKDHTVGVHKRSAPAGRRCGVVGVFHEAIQRVSGAYEGRIYMGQQPCGDQPHRQDKTDNIYG